MLYQTANKLKNDLVKAIETEYRDNVTETACWKSGHDKDSWCVTIRPSANHIVLYSGIVMAVMPVLEGHRWMIGKTHDNKPKILILTTELV